VLGGGSDGSPIHCHPPTGINAPDALIVASAVVASVDVLVTNDRSWRPRLEAVAPGLVICVLADLAAA